MIRKLSSILIFNRKYIEFKKEGESLPFFVGCVEGRFEGRFALALCFGRVAFCLNAETAEALRLERRARGRRSRGWRYCFVRVAFCLNAEIGFGF
jgi:hypothetical protein